MTFESDYKMVIGRHGGPRVDVGDIVLDLGCPLSQILRQKDGEDAPRGRVTAVFPWGLRLTDGADVWDCDRWLLVQRQEQQL